MELKGHVGVLARRGAGARSLEGDEPLDAHGENELFRSEVSTNSVPQPAFFRDRMSVVSCFSSHTASGKQEETRDTDLSKSRLSQQCSFSLCFLFFKNIFY